MSNPLENVEIEVSYNGRKLDPAPIVSYSHQPISFGYVYGYNTDISLDGIWDEISGVNSTIQDITGIFSSQFGDLIVKQKNQGGDIHKWEKVHINSINLEPNNYFTSGILKYSIKATSYALPSGVIDPSDEFSFSQDDNDVITVSHKVSARGVRDNSSAFNNAIDFVKRFTGDAFAKDILPSFMPSKKGILVNKSENIDRANGVYSVVETFKYSTGDIGGEHCYYSHTLDIDNSFGAEFGKASYNAKFYASPVEKTTETVISQFLTNFNVLSTIQSNFGYDTSKWVKNSYSASVDSGAAIIEIKAEYFTGPQSTGFFDYVVSCDKNEIDDIETWKIDGNFRCFGPIAYQLNQLESFKNENGGNNWRDFLIKKIQSSPIFSEHNPNRLFSENYLVDIQEETGLANLKLSLIMTVGYEPSGISNLKYILNGSPSKWIYELLPSATIEGSFVVQNLQTKTAPVNSFTVSCKSNHTKDALGYCSSYVKEMARTYINSGTNDSVLAFITQDQNSSGVYDFSSTQGWLGKTKLGIGDVLLNLTSIGTNGVKIPIRNSKYDFGY